MLKLLALLLLPLSLLPGTTPIDGDWIGTLKPGSVELRLVMHVKSDASGKLTMTLDSPDQGAAGIAADTATFTDNKLSFTVNRIGAAFEGTYDAAGKRISGTFKQGGGELPLTLAPYTAPAKSTAKAVPSDIDGPWNGTIEAGAQKVFVIFRLTGEEGGKLSATMDVPQQGAKAVPAIVTRDGAALKFEIRGIGAVFSGTLNEAKSVITGTWTQGPVTTPLTLNKGEGEKPAARRRPQNPIPPFPYSEQEVLVENKKAVGVKLAGTLTLPKSTGLFPAAILITGSGPQDRDETLLDHKPFLVLADALTRRGIAVLRLDDRGTAKSTGSFKDATTQDFASDIEAALDFMEQDTRIDHKHIGLIGHSEGGVVAPMVAMRRPELAYVVMLAGTSISGAKVLAGQSQAINTAQGRPLSPEVLASNAEIYRLAATNAAQPELRAAVERSVRLMMPTATPEMIGGMYTVYSSPWMRQFLAYDPAEALKKVNAPVLALFGERDLQVLASDNAPRMRELLPGAHVEIMPGLNHLFQTAKSGTPAEYAEIEETMSPKVLDLIGTWILNVVQGKKS